MTIEYPHRACDREAAEYAARFHERLGMTYEDAAIIGGQLASLPFGVEHPARHDRIDLWIMIDLTKRA